MLLFLSEAIAAAHDTRKKIVAVAANALIDIAGMLLILAVLTNFLAAIANVS